MPDRWFVKASCEYYWDTNTNEREATREVQLILAPQEGFQEAVVRFIASGKLSVQRTDRLTQRGESVEAIIAVNNRGEIRRVGSELEATEGEQIGIYYKAEAND